LQLIYKILLIMKPNRRV